MTTHTRIASLSIRAALPGLRQLVEVLAAGACPARRSPRALPAPVSSGRRPP